MGTDHNPGNSESLSNLFKKKSRKEIIRELVGTKPHRISLIDIYDKLKSGEVLSAEQIAERDDISSLEEAEKELNTAKQIRNIELSFRANRLPVSSPSLDVQSIKVSRASNKTRRGGHNKSDARKELDKVFKERGEILSLAEIIEKFEAKRSNGKGSKKATLKNNYSNFLDMVVEQEACNSKKGSLESIILKYSIDNDETIELIKKAQSRVAKRSKQKSHGKFTYNLP